jgi:hypothetical protein
MHKLEIIESKDSLWTLHCKNDKCGRFFDYFGRLDTYRAINCTHCGKSSKYHLADFVSPDFAE